MPDLAEKLRSVAARVAQENPAFAEMSAAFVSRLQSARAGFSAPSVGEALPPFLLPDTTGRLRGLTEFSGTTLVVVFLRGHWCSYCTAHAEALLEAIDQFRERKAQLALITPERSCYAAVFQDPRITVLCDMDSGYAASLGLAVAMDPAMVEHLRSTGDDVEMFNGSGWILPMPVVFVLNANGVLQSRFFNPDYRTRVSVEEILAALP
ncbi:MAG: redoxin domain-containing protein [Hyphomonadaceae bacterium]|nr:redoxin domain-containing protein [Hyphomonadaceae bacterium]